MSEPLSAEVVAAFADVPDIDADQFRRDAEADIDHELDSREWP